jgi:hypothetical protein
MKTAEPKTVSPTIQRKAVGPFFKKGNESFFGNEAVMEQTPFFASAGTDHSLVNSKTIQAKLTIGQPNDKYEQEADAMADKVVQRLAMPEAPTKKDQSIQTKPLAATTTPLMQAKCKACDKDEKLQKKEDKIEEDNERVQLTPIFEIEAKPDLPKKAASIEMGDSGAANHTLQPKPVNGTTLASTKSSIVQAKCATCEPSSAKASAGKEEKLQEKEEENSEDDLKKLRRKPIFESNEEPPDDPRLFGESWGEAVQRKCTACEKEQKLQKKSNISQSTDASSTIESQLNSSKGGGFSLPAGTKDQMESSFGADFSNVRIHTDSSAVQMSEDLHAQAFTHGSDIYFNAGKYDTNSTAGKHLLAHELTHTVQQGAASPGTTVQRYSWDEFADDVSDASDTVGEGLNDAANAVTETAQDVGQAVVGTATAVVDTVSGAASAATDWLTSEAGQLAQSFADAVGGYISITSAGLVITIPGACPFEAIVQQFSLEAIEREWMVPVFNMQVAPNLFISGEIGLTGGIWPAVQAQIGPVCFDDLVITINPVTNNYSVSGGISITSAAAIGAELRGGVRGALSLEAYVVINGVPVKITSPLVGVEGGLAGVIRAIGAQRYHYANIFSYSSGRISASPSFSLDMGLGADLFAGAYAQLDIQGENVCRIYWQPYEWHGGIAYSLGLSGSITLDALAPSLGITLNAPTLDEIPFDSIPLAIDRGGFSDDCPIIDRICAILKTLNLLPSQNGGVWDWSGTGHGGTYGPGPRLPGPLEVYRSDPGIASGSTCRGACGPNCETCDDPIVYHYTDPDTGQVWEYSNYRECNSNDGCRQHDAAFDWAAAERGEAGDDWSVTIMPWHMLANIECACNNLAGNCIAWIVGLPPYDMKMYFADDAYPISSMDALNECKETNPDFTDCTLEGSDRDEVLVLWGMDNGFENFRNCSPHRSFPPGIINACDLGPGQTWHCTATNSDTGEDVTISIFECYCCDETGSSGSDWREPHISVRLGGIDEAQSRATPMLSQDAYNKVQNHIRAGRFAAALEVAVSDLVRSGRMNPSLYNIRYVAAGGHGEGLTTTNYHRDPATGNYIPDGPSEVEIYTPAFSSVQWLVSSIMHEYQHVLQHQRMRTRTEITDPTGEHNEAGEVDAYLWEIEHSDETGMAAQPRNIRNTFGRLRDHYDALGAINPARQATFRLRYEAARQFVNDLEEAPPPLPGYAHVFHHGSDYDTIEILRTADITATGGVDFGRGFYVHTKGNWRLAREWAIRHSLGKKGWGVVTFPVPDRPWREDINEQLYFRNTRSRPANMPINPDTGRPFRDWTEFVEYNKRMGRRGALPDWSEFDVIEGPLWGRLSRTPRIHQVMFTSSGVGVLNRPDVKPLRFIRRWLFLRFR